MNDLPEIQEKTQAPLTNYLNNVEQPFDYLDDPNHMTSLLKSELSSSRRITSSRPHFSTRVSEEKNVSEAFIGEKDEDSSVIEDC